MFCKKRCCGNDGAAVVRTGGRARGRDGSMVHARVGCTRALACVLWAAEGAGGCRKCSIGPAAGKPMLRIRRLRCEKLVWMSEMQRSFLPRQIDVANPTSAKRLLDRASHSGRPAFGRAGGSSQNRLQSKSKWQQPHVLRAANARRETCGCLGRGSAKSVVEPNWFFVPDDNLWTVFWSAIRFSEALRISNPAVLIFEPPKSRVRPNRNQSIT